MCGISGVISKNGIEPEDIEMMTFALRHRGPDAVGTYLHPEGRVALGHTRLSIIDLSSEANQPFFSADGRFGIVFNGEIYNYKQLRKTLQEQNISFRTKSDTEVILAAFAAWGVKMIDKLEGMFAFAIYDTIEKKMFLFRDRLGKKPLFYFSSEACFIFASEIKSLLRHPVVKRHQEINKQSIYNFFHLGYIPEPHTIFTHIHKFPSGNYFVIDPSCNVTSQTYWSARALESGIITNEREAKKQLTFLIKEAVQKRLVSDVPVGAFLSGGVDSSLITAIAANYVAGPLKTFTIGFKENKFDERRFAAEVAAHLTEHTEYMLSEIEALTMLDVYLKHFDEPFADTSAIPTMLVSKLARQQVKVALTGDGGDELFFGYGAHRWADRLDHFFWRQIRKPLQFVLSSSGISRYERIAKLLAKNKIGSDRSHIFSQEQYFFSQDEIHEKLLINPQNFGTFEDNDSFLNDRNTSASQRQALFDLQYYLKDDLLTKVDRASMYYALECRCPLLDQHVVKYAISLDDSLKQRKGVSKWILKEMLYQYIPKHMIDRSKRGFSIPLSKWMKGELKYLIDNFLREDVIQEMGLVKPAYVNALKSDFFSGKDYLYNRLWAIIVLHKWWKENQ